MPKQEFSYGNFGKPGFHRGMSITMDTKEFEKDLDRFMTKNSIAALRRGLGKAWMQLIDDIALEQPTIPVDTSALISSITVFVNKRLFGTSSKYRQGSPVNYQQRKSTEPDYHKGEQALLVVNAPYATVQHEDFEQKSKPGAGMFFVSRKVRQYGKKYVQIVIHEVKKAKVK